MRIETAGRSGADHRSAADGSKVVNAAPPRIHRAGPNRLPDKAPEWKMRASR
jgi:hypothetical protein